MTKIVIHNDYILKVSADHVSSDLSGEVIVLSIKSGKYYGLDKVGVRVWSILHKPTKVRDIIDIIVNEYDISANQCETDLIALLEDLLKEGLIEVEKAD